MHQFALLVADDLELAALAARDGDVRVARRVLRHATGREAAHRDAEAEVRSWAVEAGCGWRRACCSLQFVGELAAISTLSTALARRTATRGVPVPVRNAMGGELGLLGTAGSRRLRHLALLGGPAMDAEFQHGGSELRECLTRLTCTGAGCRAADGPAVSSTCAALVQAVLTASRYAARAA